MCKTGFQKRLGARARTFEPSQERFHFTRNRVRLGPLEVNLFSPFGTGNHFDWSSPPRTRLDPTQSTAACWKQRRMPTKESLLGEWKRIPLRGIQHHFDDTFHISIRRPRSCHFAPHMTRE